MSMAKGGTKTALVSTGRNSNCLRTTVPMWIVETLGLSAGSKLEWKLTAENGSMEIQVSPSED
tara:strand:+ start:465 stop:653 length:189 start_codon:yes stop_codon:yes gene_type:complete